MRECTDEKMFQDLSTYSDMLDANENHFVIIHTLLILIVFR